MNSPSHNQRTQIMLTIAAAIIIVVAILGYLRSIAPAPITVDTIVAEPTEDWPTPMASVTATSTPTPMTPPPPTATATPLPSPTPIVIGGFEELGTLISLQATLQTIVEVKREGNFLLGDDRLILAAVGNVEAGVDLTKIQDVDIIVDGTCVKLTLPAATVTTVELLPNETEIFDSNRRWILSEYEGLELEASEKARVQLKNWAISRNNILAQAEEQAVIQLDAFLRQLGFEKIQIDFEE